MKNDTAQISAGQMKELSSAIIEGIPTDLSFEVAEKCIGRKTELHKRMKELLLDEFDEKVAKGSDLLQLVAKVFASGAQRFVAKDVLKEANVGLVGDNFKKLFLDKIEENIEGVTIAAYRLESASLDAPILAQLGNRAEIRLAHFFELIKKQSKGEDDMLLVNGYANIAYIKGNDGNLWAVDVYWDSGGGYWHVHAFSVESLHKWHVGSRVLSCDSL